MSDTTRGLLIVLAGVLVLSPDAALIRFITVDPWTFLFWRGLGLCVALAVLSVLRHGSAVFRDLWRAGWMGLLIAACFACSQISFVLAVEWTHPVNALVISSASPLASALFSRWLLGERFAPATLIATVVVIFGILVTVVGDGVLGGGTAIGNAVALLIPVSIGLAFTLIRKSGLREVWSVQAVTGFAVACVALVVAVPEPVPGSEMWALVLAALVVTPGAFALISLAPRYLPAAEVSLFMRLETVLGPIFVWLLVGLAPTPHALVGGLIVLGALALHLRFLLRRERQAAGLGRAAA